MTSDAFLIIFLVFLACITFFPAILRRWGIPGVISLMLVGILAGPNALNMLSHLTNTLHFLGTPDIVYNNFSFFIAALGSLGLVFLMDYPPQAASLAKIRGDVAERWEFYSNGIELANCFTELCDPDEQRRRFLMAKQERKQLGESDYPIDEEFLGMLGGIGSAAGVALGIDRLVMKLACAEDISQVRVC